MAAPQRIQYIDAMRGFTMLLVVFGHIFIYCFGYGEEESMVSSFFITFRMPMFFFISGYIGYKAIDRWTTSLYLTMLRKKAFIQLVPSFLFLFIFCAIHSHDFVDRVCTSGANIYWFTEVLFEFFLIYFTVSLFCKHVSPKLFNPIIIAIALVTIFILSFCFHPNTLTGILSLRAFCRYFQFFALGLLCRKYNSRFVPMITSQTAKTLLIIVFFSLFIFMWSGVLAENSFGFKMIHDLIIRYAGLMLVFSLFASHSDYFETGTRISRVMQFVGRRTLDIFLLHYFFLPQLSIMKPYFIDNSNMTLEFLLAMVLAILVLCISLAFSAIIRQSEFLGHALFGMKSDKYTF